MKAIGICGMGGSGKEFLDLVGRVNDNRWEEIVFVDKSVDESQRIFRGCKVYTFEETAEIYTPDEIEYVISVGNVYLRDKIYRQVKDAGYHLATIIAPGVYIPESVSLGEGVIVRDHCFISVDVVLKDNVMVQPNSVIGHDVVIGDNSIVATQCSISGCVSIGYNTYIAFNCGIKELVSIGSNSIVSMGSIVNKDVADKVIVRGNPAEVFSKNYIGSAFRFNEVREKND
ncbi:MAG: hypothetical protein K6E16_03640 [Lachnospiraceae bacterium]|nr:hypothetical protein [Lachnospiraceae bacterium]